MVAMALARMIFFVRVAFIGFFVVVHYKDGRALAIQSVANTTIQRVDCDKTPGLTAGTRLRILLITIKAAARIDTPVTNFVRFRDHDHVQQLIFRRSCQCDFERHHTSLFQPIRVNDESGPLRR